MHNWCLFQVNEIIRVLQLTTYDEDEWEVNKTSYLNNLMDLILDSL